MSKITINDEFLENVNDKIKQLGTYSTDETDTGMTWINGKKIYRKVLDKDQTLAKISTGISFDEIIKASCIIRSSIDNNWRTLPWLFGSGTQAVEGVWAGGFYIRTSDSSILFQVGSQLTQVNKIIIILEYTKMEE